MLKRDYEGQTCSAARALELVGDRWSLLILRDARFRGYTRFSQFEESLGIAPNILTVRLNRFVEQGLMTVEEPHKRRRTYLLTDKGMALTPVLIALTEWGDVWLSPGPVEFTDPTGRPVRLAILDTEERVVPAAAVHARRRNAEVSAGDDSAQAAPAAAED